MQHHLRSVAPGRLAAASRQGINRLPVIPARSNSCPFHVYAPQSLPQPTSVNSQEVASSSSTGPRTPRYPSYTPRSGPSSSSSPSSRSSQDAEDSQKRRNIPGWMIRKRATEFADARWALNPEAQADKWKRYRDEPFLLENLPDRETMTGWSMEERFKYKMVTRQDIFKGQEELNEHQKLLVDVISKRRNLLFDGVNSNPHITLALATALAQRICEDRQKEDRSTGVLIFCTTVERGRAIQRYLKTLLNCYKVNTLMVAPREFGKEIPNGTLPYEKVIQSMDDIDCHALIITRSMVQTMLLTDPDARRLLRMVDWQTVVVDEAEDTLDTAAGRALQSLNNLLPSWMVEKKPRQYIFLADNATINVKQWSNIMAMAPNPVVQVGPPKQPDPIALANKVQQGFLTFPDDSPRHLFPYLTTSILKERAANIGRFKAVVFFNSAQEARLAANYYRKVEIDPALPPIHYLAFKGSEKNAIEGSYISAKSFFEAKEGMLFTHDASLCGSTSKDITHIFQIAPIDGSEYIKRINVADLTGSDPSATIPTSTVINFPYESGWLSSQSEVLAQKNAQVTTTLANPTAEDLSATADLDAIIRPQLDPKQQDDAYMEWLKWSLPYAEMWKTDKSTLIMRAGAMFRDGWGARDRDPVVKLSFAERLGIAGEPGLLTEDNTKQLKDEQKSCMRNIKEYRHKHWRGRKKWEQKHGKAPAMTIRGIAKGTTRIT